MTYTVPALRLAIALILISTVRAESKEDSLAIARRCCPKQAAECCAETIENRLALNCSLPLEGLLSASNCIQTAMYGMKSLKRIQIEDVECCQVFSNDFTDESATCLSTCTGAGTIAISSDGR
ncbi:Her-1 [Cooperia oncophora]